MMKTKDKLKRLLQAKNPGEQQGLQNQLSQQQLEMPQILLLHVTTSAGKCLKSAQKLTGVLLLLLLPKMAVQQLKQLVAADVAGHGGALLLLLLPPPHIAAMVVLMGIPRATAAAA
jgi:hypothetical protein